MHDPHRPISVEAFEAFEAIARTLPFGSVG
jgi:hypothetical protein